MNVLIKMLKSYAKLDEWSVTLMTDGKKWKKKKKM